MASDDRLDKELLETKLKEFQPKAFDNLPSPQKDELLEAVGGLLTDGTSGVEFFQQISHSGPLPHPSILRGYEDIQPGFADRVIAMAEKQQEHRMELEKEQRRDQQTQSKCGQWMAFFLALVGLLGSIYIMVSGYPLTGSLFGGGGLVGLLTVFYKSQNAQNRQIQRKKEVSG
jgi:uncharacterized membrane protein